MRDQYSLGAYAGLIFTKLDLPPVPPVDVDKVLEWMNASSRQVITETVASYKQRFPEKQYPWRPVRAHDGKAWDIEFKTQFPELVEYVNLFPPHVIGRVLLLAQLPDEDVYAHTDPDLGIGWRVYLTSGGPKLYFNKFKGWHKDNADAQIRIGFPEIPSRIKPERFYAPLPDTPHPWALTSICAAHSVEKNTASATARLVILILPKYGSVDAAAHHDLLRRSTEKYAEDAIWY